MSWAALCSRYVTDSPQLLCPESHINTLTSSKRSFCVLGQQRNLFKRSINFFILKLHTYLLKRLLCPRPATKPFQKACILINQTSNTYTVKTWGGQRSPSTKRRESRAVQAQQRPVLHHRCAHRKLMESDTAFYSVAFVLGSSSTNHTHQFFSTSWWYHQEGLYLIPSGNQERHHLPPSPACWA
jgi:hypothetical protein